MSPLFALLNNLWEFFHFLSVSDVQRSSASMNGVGFMCISLAAELNALIFLVRISSRLVI